MKGSLSIGGISHRLYATWCQDDGGTYSVRFALSTNSGLTWSNYQTLESGLTDPAELSITAATDSVRLIYHRQAAGFDGLAYTAAGPDGSPWSSADYIEGNYHYPHLITLNCVPQAVFVLPYQKTPEVSTIVFHARPMPGEGWQLHGILQGLDPDNFRYPHITTDLQGRLHVIWENWATEEVRYARSTDTGDQWDHHRLLVQCQSSCSYLAASSQGILAVFDSLRSDGRPIFGRFSSDFGESWSDTFRLVSLAADETPECFLVAGTRSRHLVFQKSNSTSPDLWYLAQDDVLLSNEPEATAPSSGRHLVRDPMNNRLHLVYFSQNRPHYTYSDDQGSHWAPYHIIDNMAQSSKDLGKFPSIGLYASPSETFEPCVAYISPASTGDTLKYRWWNSATNTWEGFWLCNAGIFLSAPSVTTFGEMIGVAVVAKNPALGQYVVCYYEFPYYATGPGIPEIIQSGFLDTYASPCITVDGNWDKHAVYEENGEIVYERRIGPNTWVRDPAFPPSPLLRSKTPFVEFYGDRLYVPYAEEEQPSGYYDVYRRWRNLYQQPVDWSARFNVSSSWGIPSESPVGAWGDFTVWSELGWGDGEFDIMYCWHPESRSGFVCLGDSDSYHPHAQMYYDWLGGSTALLTAWTHGYINIGPPFRVAFRKISFLPPPGDFGTYYAVSTGNPIPSFFCTKRDSFVRYQRYKVDFGKDELAYTLTLLNPTYPAYRVKVFSYFEGTGNRTEKVLIDGKEYATLDLKPNQLDTSELLIPKEYYKGDHKAVVTFRGSQVTKAGLIVQQLEQAKVGGYSGGGAQSVSTDKLVVDNFVEASPNPTKGAVAITYSLVNPGDVKLRLYDASGRMIQELAHGSTSAGTHQVALKQGLPAGVYFVMFEIDGRRIIRKIAIIR